MITLITITSFCDEVISSVAAVRDLFADIIFVVISGFTNTHVFSFRKGTIKTREDGGTSVVVEIGSVGTFISTLS